MKIVVAGIVGVLVGITGQLYLAIGFYSLIPWGIIGIALGAWSSKRQWVAVGIVYGFCLCFAFMIAGYKGAASLISRIPFFVVIGVFGALCGVPLTFIGHYLKTRLNRPTETANAR